MSLHEEGATKAKHLESIKFTIRSLELLLPIPEA